jgi:hypothetical protein
MEDKHGGHLRKLVKKRQKAEGRRKSHISNVNTSPRV